MSLMTGFSVDESLWDFVLEVYADPHICENCLQLQDKYSVNINLLLWSYWLAHKQVLLTEERLVNAAQIIESWNQDYVQVLRGLRRKLKNNMLEQDDIKIAVREKIKQAELLAEKQELFYLEKLVEFWPTHGEQIVFVDNLKRYLDFLNVPNHVTEQTLNIFVDRK